jgi:hypothetical protein
MMDEEMVDAVLAPEQGTAGSVMIHGVPPPPGPTTIEELMSGWPKYQAQMAVEHDPDNFFRFMNNADGLVIHSDYSGGGGGEIGCHDQVHGFKSIGALFARWF